MVAARTGVRIANANRPKKHVFSAQLCLLVAATETTVLSLNLDGKRASESHCCRSSGRRVERVDGDDPVLLGASLVVRNVTRGETNGHVPA